MAVPIIIIVASSAEPLRNPARITATRLLPMIVSPRMDTSACLVPPQASFDRAISVNKCVILSISKTAGQFGVMKKCEKCRFLVTKLPGNPRSRTVFSMALDPPDRRSEAPAAPPKPLGQGQESAVFCRFAPLRIGFGRPTRFRDNTDSVTLDQCPIRDHRITNHMFFVLL
jgi:hypothetical protein